MLVLALLFAVSLESLQAGQSGMTCTVTAASTPVAGAEIVVAGRTYVTVWMGVFVANALAAYIGAERRYLRAIVG